MSGAIAALLIVEDNPGDARLIREMFNEHGAHTTELHHVESMAEAERHLAGHAVDVIVLDLGLPDAAGLDAVRRAHSAAPRAPLVVLTGLDDESLAGQALQEGAQDYLIKGQIETRGLLRALRYAIERKSMEEALHVERERAEVTLKSIGDAVICTNVSGNITFVNLVAEKLTGWPSREAFGLPVAGVLRIVDASVVEVGPDTPPALTGTDGQTTRHSSGVLVGRDGSEIPVEQSVAPIRDREGAVIGAVIVFRDVSAARAMQVEIAHSAQHDFLTGLPNRMLFSDRLGQAIASAERHGNQVAVMFLDLDGFKHINDSLGHGVGDRLLRSIAGRLGDNIRGNDTVSRQGGDEFVLLLADVDRAEAAATTAARILRDVARVHRIEHHEIHVTTSIGVSIYPDDGVDAETLIMNADTAMYAAKESGRDSYRFFKRAMNLKAVERQSIEASLRSAIDHEELMLYYQPKIDLTSGAIIGAEALLRWMHPTRGLVSPADFIPVAEDCGLIVPIGNWVLREACRKIVGWADAGLPIVGVAVNVSAVEFRNRHFLTGVLAVLEETGLDPRLLEVELTESVFMKNAESVVAVLDALRRHGVQIAIDDFGTGYSSLSYLHKFPINALKIDQSFIHQIATAPTGKGIVKAIISMGSSLGLRVIAEGVETVDQLAFLQAHGCSEVQGYLTGRPMPHDRFAAMLREGLPVHPMLGPQTAVSSVEDVGTVP